MIIERNVFRLKFGKAKESIAIWKEILNAAKSSNIKAPEMRLLSDISGSAYTLVVEMHINGFNDINPKQAVWATTEKFQELYQKFIPLCDSATREYYKIEAII
ncbi:MAG: hypothetical protein ABI723_20675 [Bacteroidia bacterium]